jgi:hypothetical protein
MPSIINAATSGGLISTADTSGVLQLQTASTTALTINGSQNVGIGTTSPQSLLELKSTTGTVTARLNSASGSGREYGLASSSTGGFGIYDFTGSSYVTFINSSGNVSLKNATTSANGIGITFPATQSASSDANTLDDYEEGTYTVTFTPQTSGSITLGVNTAAYTKIGRMVTVTGSIDVSSVSSPTGTHIKMNLPFTVANSDTTVSSGVVNFNVLGSSKAANIGWATIPKNTTTVEIYDGSVNSVGTGAFATYIVANTNCRFSLTYFTS